MLCKKKKKKPSRSAAEQITDTAAARTSAAVDQAVDYLTPYVATASEYLQTAGERVGPAAKQARENAAKFAQEQLQPAFVEALNRVSPAVDRARDRVQADLVPRLVDLLETAESHPAVAEAARRSQAAVAAAKGEVEAPHTVRLSEVVQTSRSAAPAKRSAGRRVAKVVAATALLAGAAVAVRQFLAARDDAWTAPPDAGHDRSHGPTLLDEHGNPQPASASQSSGKTPKVEPDVTTEGDPAQEMVEEGSPVKQASTSAKSPASKSTQTKEPAAKASSPRASTSKSSAKSASKESSSSAKSAPNYGDGSYIGTEPPEGYTIKGNERSMKYHVPSAGGYDRTIADVWFSSEEAAEKAGFTRALR